MAKRPRVDDGDGPLSMSTDYSRNRSNKYGDGHAAEMPESTSIFGGGDTPPKRGLRSGKPKPPNKEAKHRKPKDGSL